MRKLQNYQISFTILMVITCLTFKCTANVTVSSSHQSAIVWFPASMPPEAQKISDHLLLKHQLSSDEGSSDDIISLLLAPTRSPQPVSEATAVKKYRYAIGQQLLQHLFVNEYRSVFGNSIYSVKYPYKLFSESRLDSELGSIHSELDVTQLFSLKVISVSMVETSERVVVVRALLYRYQGGKAAGRPVPVVGVCHVPHELLRKVYLLSRGSVLWQASMNCAREAVHILWAGGTDPFASAGSSMLIAPTPSLPDADLLQFTSTGRVAVPEGLKNLPTNDSALFHPNTLPLTRGNVLYARSAIEPMESIGVTPQSLWNGTEPNLNNVKKLGKRLKVNYVLMARISDLEATSGPTQRRPFRFDGRAIAVGDLVRVSDGAVLWQLTAEDTMLGYKAEQSETVKIMRFAELFALSGIADKFDTYKKSFLALPEITHNAYIHN